MIIATEANAGEKPRCLECGTLASYIELNGNWRPNCEHGLHNYTTKERVMREFEHAFDAMQKAHKRLLKFVVL